MLPILLASSVLKVYQLLCDSTTDFPFTVFFLFLACGEPPLCLSCSALFAVKRAIESARAETGKDELFVLCANSYSATYSLTNSNLATCSLTNSYSATYSLTNSNLATHSLTNSYSATYSLTNSNLATCSLTNSYSATYSLTNSNLATCSLTNSYSAMYSLTSSNLATCSLTDSYPQATNAKPFV